MADYVTYKLEFWYTTTSLSHNYKIILNIPDVIRTGIMLYNMNPKARPHTQYDN